LKAAAEAAAQKKASLPKKKKEDDANKEEAGGDKEGANDANEMTTTTTTAATNTTTTTTSNTDNQSSSSSTNPITSSSPKTKHTDVIVPFLTASSLDCVELRIMFWSKYAAQSIDEFLYYMKLFQKWFGGEDIIDRRGPTILLSFDLFSTFTSAGDSTLNDAEQFVMHESSKKNIWFNRAVLRGKDTAGFYYFPSLSAQLCWKSLHVEVFQSLVEQAKKAKLPPIKQIVFERLSCVQRGDLHLVARDKGVEFMLCG